MIARARPKYLREDFFENINMPPAPGADEIFFNSGRSALKFFLQIYSSYLNRQLVVAMQSFNCYAVAEAALQAGCKILLLDINTSDFSIGPDELEHIGDKPDILLLTHYQGIPNCRYLDISQRCRERGIFLIDDISQTEYSYADGILVGSYSDISLRSFAFDKPFTSFTGGGIGISNLKDLSLKRLLLEEYSKLEYEDASNSDSELKLLRLLFNYTDEEFYCGGPDNYTVLRAVAGLSLKNINVPAGLRKKFFGFLCKTAERLPIYRRAYRDGIDIRRLSDKKVNLILRQRENYTCNNSEVLALEYFLSANNIEVKKLDRCEINWNRYSILDEDGGIERSLKKLGIECGNYNWPTPLHLIYDNDGNVVFKEGCKMSEYVSGHILNIPIWSSFFRRIYNDVDIQTKV